MAKKRTRGSASKDERKKRTSAHIIADLSVNFVERFVLKCGYVAHREHPDYGFDLRLTTFDDRGNVEGECNAIQLKATDNIDQYKLVDENSFSFPIETKDYRLWCEETVMPVYLILYDARIEEAYWLDVQTWNREHRPQPSGATLQVHIPSHQVLGLQTIRIMRNRKQQVLDRSRS